MTSSLTPETVRTAGAAFPRLVPPRREPPERDPPLIPYLLSLRNDGLAGFPRRAYEEWVVRRPLLGRASLTVNDPDAIRHVLVDNAGNYARSAGTVRILRPILGDGLLISGDGAWRHQRRTLAPAFTPRAIDGLAPLIAAAIDRGVEEIGACAARGPVDLLGALHALALEIAGRSMFSVAMDTHGPALRGMVGRYGERLGRPHLLDILMPPGWRVPLDRPRARFRRDWTALLDAIIAARASQPGSSRDLLDLLAGTRDAETGAPFTPSELRDQVATMLLAGHETTAVTLFWALYVLALAPEMQEAVAAEAAVADLADPAGCAADGRLPLTRAVVDETLRLYPPAFVLVRRAVGPDTVAGIPLRPGDIVLISPWVLHRHRRLWDDPDAFDPARFLPGAPPSPRFAYLPFGAGPRVCIGAQFALTEAVLALAKLLARFRVALADARPVLPAAVVTTQPENPPRFVLARR